MSCELLGYAFKVPLPPPEKLLLLLLADSASPEDGSVQVQMKQMADVLGMDLPALGLVVKALRRDGWIVMTKDYAGEDLEVLNIEKMYQAASRVR